MNATAFDPLEFPELQNISVDDHAARILRSASFTVSRILERRAAMDRAGKQNDPLYVFLGHFHSNPAHYLCAMAIIALVLQKEQGVVVGHEYPHDTLRNFFDAVRGQPDIWRNIPPLDHKGNLSLVASMAYKGSRWADLSQRCFYRFCTDIAARKTFNDASKITDTEQNRQFLNMQDLSTSQSAAKCFSDIPPDLIPRDKIDILSPTGVFIRNHHMLKMAQQYRCRIFVQYAGSMHVLSSDHTIRTKLRHSLSGLSYKPVNGLNPGEFFSLVMGKHNRFFIDKADTFDREFIANKSHHPFALPDLPEIFAAYHFVYNAPVKGHTDMLSIPGLEAKIERREPEAAYLNALLRHPQFVRMGFDRYVLEPEEVMPRVLALQNKLVSMFSGEERVLSVPEF